MPRRDDPPPLTRGVVLRSVVFAVAVALGAVAVWLIVNSGDNTSRVQLGVLAGLWSALLGTFALLGNRRGYVQRDSRRGSYDDGPDERRNDPRDDRGHDGTGSRTAKSLEIRSDTTVERQRDAEERRAWQDKLEALIRHEVQQAMSGELASLRSEIASLRGDLLEKVGGQLRLERIETTRVIGSDLEALQHEVRQLKNTRDSLDLAGLVGLDTGRTADARRVVEPAQVRPVSRQTQQVQDEIQPARRSATQDPLSGPMTVAEPMPVSAPQQAPEPMPVSGPQQAPVVPPRAPVVPPVVPQSPVQQSPVQPPQRPAAQRASVPTPPAQAPPVLTPPVQSPAVPPPPVHSRPVHSPPVHSPAVQRPPVQSPGAQPPPADARRHGTPDESPARSAAHAAPVGPPRHSMATDDTGPLWSRASMRTSTPPAAVQPAPGAPTTDQAPTDQPPPAAAPTAPVAPEPAAPEPVAPEPAASEPAAPEPAAPEPVAPAPAERPTTPRTTPPAARVETPPPARSNESWAFEDGLDSLPRLTPFTDIEPEPVKPAPTDAARSDGYHGRRRRTDDDEPPADPQGRHSDRPVGHRHRSDDADPGPARASGERSGGRRRRDDDVAADGDTPDNEGLLARLLERETAR